MDREKVIRAVEDLLDALGEDGNREGLRDTPPTRCGRVRRAAFGRGADCGRAFIPHV